MRKRERVKERERKRAHVRERARKSKHERESQTASHRELVEKAFTSKGDRKRT